MDPQTIRYISLLFFLTNFVQADVPVFMWSEKVALERPLPSSNFDTYLRQSLDSSDSKLLSFILPSLSLEDLSVYGKSHMPNLESYLEGASILPAVTHPSYIVEQLSPIQTVNSPAQLDSALEDSSVVIVPVELTGDRSDSLRHADQVIGQYMKKASESHRKVIALLTGKTSSWMEGRSENRVRRHLMSVDASNDTDHFFNFNCGLLNIGKNVTYGKNGQAPMKNQTLTVDDATLTSCDSNSSRSLKITMETGWLDMLYVASPSGKGWKLANITAALLGHDETDLKVVPEEAVDDVPAEFSYSCNKLVLATKNTTHSHYSLTLHHFQVQPFSTNTSAFLESYDCEPFFTIPIFMGIFVGCFMTTVLAVGIYMLFNIKTPDRFDDPKSRLLSLAPAE